MLKREALKLKPGQSVVYGDSMWTRDLDGRQEIGIVRAVTPRGGVRVEREGVPKWVPYHYIVRIASAVEIESLRQ